MPTTTEPTPIEIVPFRAEHAAAFDAINREWLVAYGLFEPLDDEHLGDPQRTIIDAGGAIFVALSGDVVVGTAALAAHAPGEMELIKVTVAPHARGTGLGRRLIERCIAAARRSGARRLVLVSNSALAAALRLYESLGFQHRPVPPGVPYATADVYMELALDDQASPSFKPNSG